MDTVEIAWGAKPEQRATIRRPTDAELSLALVTQLAGICTRKVAEVQRLEASPADGDALRIAQALMVVEDATRELRKRLVRCFVATGAPEAAARLEALPDGEDTAEVWEVSSALVEALAPAGRLPK